MSHTQWPGTFTITSRSPGCTMRMWIQNQTNGEWEPMREVIPLNLDEYPSLKAIWANDEDDDIFDEGVAQ